MNHDFLLSRGRRMPVILQTEAAECGLACLAMIGCHYGHDISLQSLRQRISVSNSGMTLSALSAAADSLALRCRFARAEPAELEQLQLPVIAHWDLNHFVVIGKVHKGEVVVHDPAHGKRTMTIEEVGRHFTGLAIEVTPTPTFQPVVDRPKISLTRVLGRLVGWKAAGGKILLLAAAIELVSLLMPFQAQWLLDKAIPLADWPLLLTLSLCFLGLSVVQSCLTMARGWALSWLGATVSFQWVTNLFGHLVRLPMDYFEKRHVGDVTSRFSSIDQIQRTLGGNFLESILDGGASCFAILMLFAYNVSLGLLALLLFAAYAAARVVFYRRFRSVGEELLVFRARQQSEMLESIRGMQAIKLANKHLVRQQRFSNMVMEATRRDLAIQRLTFGFASFSQFVFSAQRVLIFLVAGRAAILDHITIGMLVAASAFAEQFIQRASLLVDRCIELGLLRMHLERISDISMQAPENEEKPRGSQSLGERTWELRDVSFRYGDGEPWILRHFSMVVKEGSSLAVTGRSGCGKSTLAKIVLGLLKPSEGKVLFGGIPIEELGMGAYREAVAAVMQDDQLFAGTISENISFFTPEASQQDIEDAARQAAIHAEITAMPMGYQTLVGDMGSTLSGGQKQRVLLARALFRRPVGLVLDEATSHLDSKAEGAVNREVARLHMTRLIIAHRRETIASADYVFDLSEGRFVDQGGNQPEVREAV